MVGNMIALIYVAYDINTCSVKRFFLKIKFRRMFLFKPGNDFLFVL